MTGGTSDAPAGSDTDHPIIWVATNPPKPAAVWSPARLLDQNKVDDTLADNADEDSEPEGEIVEEDEMDLSPASLANFVEELRKDLKVFAFEMAKDRNLRKAETKKSVNRFFSTLDNKQLSDTKSQPIQNKAIAKSLEAFTDLYKAQKGLPVKMAALRHIETILRYMAESPNDASKHHEEYSSLLDAQIEIRELKATLAMKEKELSDLHERLNNLKEQRHSIQSLLPKPSIEKLAPVAASALNVSGIFNKIRRGSGFFSTAASAPTPTVITETKNVTALTVIDPHSPPKSIETDLQASLGACGGWFQEKETYDFFISYRVSSEARVAMELYFRLKDQRIMDERGNSRQVTVFWDKECLKKGQDWRDGFVQGLKNSRCVLMLVSGGATEPMVWSNENPDNVLLEWETAVMAGQKNICVPQPVFINDNLKGIKGLDDASKFLKSDKCPTLRPNKADAHKWAASKTLYEVKQIQGVQLDVNEVSWSIPDLIKALQTYAPLQMKAAANQCATEASFFQQFPDTSFDSTEFNIKFLSSFDLMELFGSEKDKKIGILEYRKSLKHLSVSFRTNPRMSRNSMEILTHGLKQNYSFLRTINLSGANLADKQIWNLLTEALKVNNQLESMDLTDNDLTGLPDPYKVIENHNSIYSCTMGSNAGFEATSLLRDGIEPNTYYTDMDAYSLLLLTELWEYGKPRMEMIVFAYNNTNVKEEDVPESLGLLLGKLPGLKSIEIQSEALIGALTTCIVNSDTITDISIGLAESAKPAKKKSGSAGANVKDSGSNKIEKKQSQPWMKPLCDALVRRGKELAKQAALKAATEEEEARNAETLEHERNPASEHERSPAGSADQVNEEGAEEDDEEEEEDDDDESGSDSDDIIEDHKLSLSLNNLGLTDQDVTLLANAFRKMKNGLAYLIMDENEISAVGFSSLLKVFTNACTVDTLSLDGNNIGPGCAKDLHKFAREATGLSGLYLARNPLGESAVKMLFEGLAMNENPTIERLSLRQTNIADNAARAISTAIEGLSALDLLDLSKNDFTSSGFIALASGLHSNKSLTNLTICDIPMNEESVDAFVNALKAEDRTLEHLDVSQCQLGDALAAKILNLSTKEFSVDISSNGITGDTQFTEVFCSKILAGDIFRWQFEDDKLSLEFFKKTAEALATMGRQKYDEWTKLVDEAWDNHCKEQLAQKLATEEEESEESAEEVPQVAEGEEEGVAAPLTKKDMHAETAVEPFSELAFEDCLLDNERVAALFSCIPDWTYPVIKLTNCGLDDTVIDLLLERLTISPLTLAGEITLNANDLTERGLEKLLLALKNLDQIRLEGSYEYPRDPFSIYCKEIPVSADFYRKWEFFTSELQTVQFYINAVEEIIIDV